MALASTLSAAEFADLFSVQDVQFVQAFQQQRSITGGGVTRRADRAPSLWMAKVTTAPMSNAHAEGIMALINSRGGGLKTVALYNYRLPYPASDPDGSIIGATVPTINVITDRLHLSFSNFPAGYEIPLGTFFGVTWDSGNRYYLGQFAEARTANPITGAVASVEIWPPLPASIASGAEVTVSKPCAKFAIEPGSAYPSKVTGMLATIEFAAEQTYGA